ncbi:monocarboxylate uptake permease MctP [Microvirga terricola]|uniref:Sodium:solute symporter n=1 Tax=Microvirga terricola TaxID=2719797 RepID=A0ABX0VE43_9HYPH|nr:sodium:solute symporter [Microvirga terricola]NIX77756.1 sodium:solute symporter [Microvirga terricola]
MNWTALIIFVLLFGFITVLGFVAANWRKGDLDLLHEWGLAGRRLGTVVIWFLLGGDVYTAYTFIAVPALVFGAGAIGFFALPYTIIVYPLVFLILPRMWAVAHKHNYITAADFVEGRYGNRWLALAVAITGIVATMPYIALQLLGIEVVIGAMGVEAPGLLGDLPLIIAFVILAAFTYTSGLRAPAMIAVVKDTLIYITVIAMVVVIPIKLGGYASLFADIPESKLLLTSPKGGNLGQYSAYATLALGSAFALFLYPHTVTAILSSSGREVIRRNAAYLPAYSFLLGLLALTGFMALAANVNKLPEFADHFARYGSNFAVPALILHSFPDWFAGIAFAAIAIGGLVPAAIMSIAASNLFTRNIYVPFINPDRTPQQEAKNAKIVSLIVKFGALIFIIFLPLQYAIQLQLLGGIWISQTIPTVIVSLYTAWLNPWALLAGWAVGIVTGTWMAATQSFQSAVVPFSLDGLTIPGYAALYALGLNFIVSIVLSLVLNQVRATRGADQTVAADYQM